MTYVNDKIGVYKSRWLNFYILQYSTAFVQQAIAYGNMYMSFWQ